MQDKTKHVDAVRIATGTISDEKLVICAFDFNFMGSSMGIVVGESIVRAAEEALRIKKPLLIITVSGGARIQGALSLMQMPKSMVAVEMMKIQACLIWFINGSNHRWGFCIICNGR